MEAKELDARRVRAATNQSLFREVNERLEELDRRLSGPMFIEFVCECASDACTEAVALTEEEYEHVRAGVARFLIKPGHDLPEVEHVAEATDRYVVVEKIGAGHARAAELDPRTS